MLIDTHCHISKNDYDDIEKIIEDDFKEVDKIIISGCSKKDIIESLEIAEKNENIFVNFASMFLFLLDKILYLDIIIKGKEGSYEIV